jgi:hypothetical protein
MLKRNVTLILMLLLVPCFLMGQAKKFDAKHKITPNANYMPSVIDNTLKLHKGATVPGQDMGLANNYDYWTNSIMRNVIVYWNGVKFAQMIRPFGTGTATVRHVVYTERDSATGAFTSHDVFGGQAGYCDIDIARTDVNVGTVGIVGHTPNKLALWDGSAFAVATFAPGDDPSIQLAGPTIWMATSGNAAAGRDQFQFYKSPDGISFVNWDSISSYSPTPIYWTVNGSTECAISKSPDEQYVVYYSNNSGDGSAYDDIALDSCDNFWTLTSTNNGTSWTPKVIAHDGVIGLVNGLPDYAPNIENFGQVDLSVTNAGVMHAVANGYGVDYDAAHVNQLAARFPVLYYNSASDKWISISDPKIDTIQDIATYYPGNSIGQGYPSVAVSEDGKVVYACWTGPQVTGTVLDTASDSGTPYYWRDLYQTWSVDGGATWKPVQVLSGDKTVSETFASTTQLLRFDPVQSKYVADITYLVDLAPDVSVFSGAATTNPVMYDAFTIPDMPVGVNDGSQIARSFNLNQNYPNPFNPSTKIDYTLPEKSNVSLKVYDMLGREVANLVNATQEAGNHTVNFNASKLASGLYISTLKSGNNVMSKKMMLLK